MPRVRTPEDLYPRVSIVTPSFNQGQFLEECIESILGQNYPNLEYVIMDGGSTDNSLRIIKKYEKYLTYWRSQADNGQYFAINEGFRKTTGEIMAWLNSDDKYHPHAFFKVAAIFRCFNHVEWITGRRSCWDKNGDLWDIEPLASTWSREKYLRWDLNPCIQQESTFWRRSIWEKAGGTLKTDLVFAGDTELWIRFFRYTQLYSVDTFIGGYRLHGDQKAQKFLDEYNLEADKIIGEEISFYNNGIDKTLLPAPPIITVRQGAFLSDAYALNAESIREFNCWRGYLNKLEIFMKFAESNGLDVFHFLKAELSMINNIRSKPLNDEERFCDMTLK